MTLALPVLLLALARAPTVAAAADFIDATGGLPLGDAGPGYGVAWGDYDGDGDLDLFLSNSGGTSRLFRNDGMGVFVDVAAAAGLAVTGASRGVAWGDYDNDGDLDLYVGKYSAQANRLFRNDGGTFADVTGGLPLGDTGWTLGVAWGDYPGQVLGQ